MFVYLHLYGHIGWSHGQSNFSTSTVKSAYLSLYGLAEGVSDIYTVIGPRDPATYSWWSATLSEQGSSHDLNLLSAGVMLHFVRIL